MLRSSNVLLNKKSIASVPATRIKGVTPILVVFAVILVLRMELVSETASSAMLTVSGDDRYCRKIELVVIKVERDVGKTEIKNIIFKAYVVAFKPLF